MAVGLNLLYADPDTGGAWIYITRLLKALAARDTLTPYIVYCADDVDFPDLPANSRIIRFRLPRGPRRRFARVMLEQVSVPRRAASDGCACLHWFGGIGGYNTSLPSLVSVYDIKPLERSETARPSLRDLYFRTAFPGTVRRATRLLAMSQATASAIASHFPGCQSRLAVLPPAIGDEFRPSDVDAVEHFRRRHNLAPRYWLYVAHYYPHKNHARLLEAYSAYVRQSPDPWPLVLCGSRRDAGPLLDRLCASLGIADRVRWLSGLPAEEMPLLYSAAGAMIFPSLYEGCGIPLLEALACGCPIAASDIPAVAEFAPSVYRFRPDRTGEITAALTSLSRNDELRASLASQGLDCAPNASTPDAFRLLLDCYRKALGHAAPADLGGQG